MNYSECFFYLQEAEFQYLMISVSTVTFEPTLSFAQARWKRAVFIRAFPNIITTKVMVFKHSVFALSLSMTIAEVLWESLPLALSSEA